jgi:hypothetical protein
VKDCGLGQQLPPNTLVHDLADDLLGHAVLHPEPR